MVIEVDLRFLFCNFRLKFDLSNGFGRLFCSPLLVQLEQMCNFLCVLLGGRLWTALPILSSELWRSKSKETICFTFRLHVRFTFWMHVCLENASAFYLLIACICRLQMHVSVYIPGDLCWCITFSGHATSFFFLSFKKWWFIVLVELSLSSPVQGTREGRRFLTMTAVLLFILLFEMRSTSQFLKHSSELIAFV